MKLHLPRLLSAALLAAFVSSPVYSASIPDGYNPIELKVPGLLKELQNSNTESVPTALLLFDGKDYTYTFNDATATAPFYEGASLYFTSAPNQSSVELIFTVGYTRTFSEVNQLTFADMSLLQFSAMKSGAIYSWGDGSSLTISGITDRQEGTSDVEFLGNNITGNCGGAIDAQYTTVSLDNNGSVLFNLNHALAKEGSSGNQNQGSTGGTGISSSSAYSLNLFGLNLSFEFGFGIGFSYEKEDNPQTPVIEQRDICGGAINLVDSIFSMTKNEAVTFTHNTAVDYGGAISASPGTNSIVLINENGQVLFESNNTAGHIQNDHVVGGGGGAIFIGSQGKLVMDSNTGDIIFKKNHAAGAGGAIYHGGQEKGSILLTSNGNISFEGNTVGGTGGAIHMQQGGSLEIAGNTGIIRFEHNEAGVSGGAISSLNAFLTLNDNAEVLFLDNLVFHQMLDVNDKDSFSSYYVGGAIYGTNIQIHNNDAVLFQRNAEIVDENYFRLRSLHVEGSSASCEVSLSAGEGKSIEFRDSIYINSDLHLNSAYNGNLQEGNIIFSGESTVEDLKIVKEAWKNKAWNTQNITVTPTQTEIDESRTSIVLGETKLNGGRLWVENGAIFKSCGISLTGGSKSTLRLLDAKLVNIDASGNTSNSSGSSLNVGTGTTLEISGRSTIEGGKLVFSDNSNWNVHLTKANGGWNTAALTLLQGVMAIEGNLTLSVDLSGSTFNDTFCLFNGSAASYANISKKWTKDNIKVVGTGDAAGATFDDLYWRDGALYYDSTLVWTNDEGTSVWDKEDKNWRNNLTFHDSRFVKFTDAGQGGEVTLVGRHAPGIVTVDANVDYTFTGKDGESGFRPGTDIVKRGDGALTLDVATEKDGYNDTGSVSLEEGTLNLHDDNALGGSVLKTEAGTTLAVGDASDVVLQGKEHAIKGNVEVAEDSSLEVASGSYAASSKVDGELIFNGQSAWNAGSLSGSGSLEVTNGASVTFKDASGFTGNVNVTGSSSSFFLKVVDSFLKAGEIAVSAGDLTLRASEQLTMAGGSVLSMVAGTVAEKVTTVLADKVIEFASNAMLSAMLNGMLGDLQDPDLLNEGVGGAVGGAGITLNAGSTLKLEKCHIGMYSNDAEPATLTLNITPESTEKINLVLMLDDILTEDSMVLLFSGVDKVNFVYDGTIISGNGPYECDANHYFTGSMVGADTKLVYSNGNVYMKGLVPEPATATLSLLALAALATRRRRR